MKPLVERFGENPLIGPEEVAPSREGWEVVSVINAGAAEVDGEIVLLARVAERPVTEDPNLLSAPMLDLDSDPPEVWVLRVRRDDAEVESADPRLFSYRGQTYLTSMSHLRVARSREGRAFTVEPEPAFCAREWYEAFGVEDPRITPLEGRFLISYTAVSRHGIATGLAETKDFREFARRGLIFAPENRDVTIFPERFKDRYFCHHRPVARTIGGFAMWGAYSPDLAHWGEHAAVIGPRPGRFDGARVGGGAVPVRTERGWLCIYHGAAEKTGYALGALLCDLERPEKVIARSAEPILRPEADYETKGFFDNVVFTNGAVLRGDDLIIYYGGADRCICGVRVGVEEVLDSLEG